MITLRNLLKPILISRGISLSELLNNPTSYLILDIRLKTSFSAAMSEALKEIKEKSKEVKDKTPYKSRFRYNGKHKKRQWEDDTRTPEEIEAKKTSMNPEDKVKRRKSVILMG